MDNSRIRYAIITIAGLFGDGQLLDQVCGTAHNRKKRKCRICTQRCCALFTPDVSIGDLRNDFEHHVRASRAFSVLKSCYDDKRSPMFRVMYKKDKPAKLTLQWIAKLGIREGDNPVYELFYYWNQRSSFGLHNSVPPDTLHVIYKGVVENVIAWSLQIIHRVAHLDSVQYSNNLGLLDLRIMYFPDINLGDQFSIRFVRFSKGITPFLKVSATTGIFYINSI